METLKIDAGFWRVTPESDVILACYNADACRGGETGAEDYCAPGYNGPCERGEVISCCACLSSETIGHASSRGCSLGPIADGHSFFSTVPKVAQKCFSYHVTSLLSLWGHFVCPNSSYHSSNSSLYLGYNGSCVEGGYHEVT